MKTIKLVFAVCICCFVQQAAAQDFEGIITYKITAKSLDEGFMQAEVESLFPNLMHVYCKADKMRSDIVGSTVVGDETHIVNYTTNYVMTTQKENDTILKFKLDASKILNYTEIVKEHNSKETNKKILKQKCLSVDVTGFASGSYFEGTEYYTKKYTLPETTYKNYCNAPFDVYTQNGAYLKLYSKVAIGGIVEVTMEATNITTKKLSDDVFKLDSDKIIIESSL